MNRGTRVYIMVPLFTLALLGYACSSSKGPLFQTEMNVPVDQAIVYLYRPDDKNSTEFTMTYNGAEIVVLEKETYIPLFIAPGKVEITSKVRFKMFVTGVIDAAVRKPSEFVFEALAGKVYYVECLANESGGQALSISLAPERYGRIRIQKCRLTPGKTR